MDDKTRTPPYVSYATFKNNLRAFATSGIVPSRIDLSLLGSLSGSSKAQFMSALRFFELINAEGAPSPVFKSLAIGTEPEWKSSMAELLKRFYPAQNAILASGTPRQLQESFGDIGGIAKPASRFFLLAAKDAGIAVGPHLCKGKGASGGQARKVRRRLSDIASPISGNGPESRPVSEKTDESYEKMLLGKFPQFDPSWDAERQKAWFAAYQTLLGMRKTDTDNSRGPNPVERGNQ